MLLKIDAAWKIEKKKMISTYEKAVNLKYQH